MWQVEKCGGDLGIDLISKVHGRNLLCHPCMNDGRSSWTERKPRHKLLAGRRVPLLQYYIRLFEPWFHRVWDILGGGQPRSAVFFSTLGIRIPNEEVCARQMGGYSPDRSQQ
jgi:hypothetical protein